MAILRLRFVAVLGATVLGGLLPAPDRASADSIEEKAQICSACHGENGVPQEKNRPIIWGQNEGYLYLQLRDFNSGARKQELMTPVAGTLERADMLALAEYFSKKKWPDLGQPRAPKDVADRALRANTSIGCTSCHFDQWNGDSSVPRLAGQNRDYLAKTIADFRTRARGNNPGMSDLMLATPQEDLDALVNYLAGL